MAADAGLSVPYIANLENGRGNPTLAAIAALARALGLTLRIEFAEDAADAGPPDSLIEFTRGRRFHEEVRHLPPEARERLLTAMAALGEVAGRPLTELDWHRVLDTVVLLNRRTPAG